MFEGLWYKFHKNLRTVDDYANGDRVMNINSMSRKFIPYGFRGTVVGRTSDKLIVLFDDQILGATEKLRGITDDFRCAHMDPEDLLNLTQKFCTVFKS